MPPNSLSAPSRDRSIFDLSGRLHDFQAGPKIDRPNLVEELIPVVGPAWDAAADLQVGNYKSALFNAGMAGLDLLPVGYGLKALRAASKINRELGTLRPTARAVADKMRQLGLAGKDDRIHHVFEIGRIGSEVPRKMRRRVPSLRNNPLNLKVLPKETHERLRQSSGGKPPFGPLLRHWHGTRDWMKAGEAGIAGYSADMLENLALRSPQQPKSSVPPPSRSGGIFPSPYFLLP